MSDKYIILIGSGGHARACIDVIEQEGIFSIAGLIGLPEEVGQEVLGYPVLGKDSDIPHILKEIQYAFITIGQIKSHKERERLFNIAAKNKGEFPTIISPQSYISEHAKIGCGTIVMHGAIVNASASVGDNCIINSQSLIEHDSLIENHCHIATAAIINSGVHIKKGSFIGSNSTVRQGIVVGKYSVIGMGESVLTDCETGTWLPRKLMIGK